MKYPLPALTLNEEECKHIMQPILKFGLTKPGISSNLHSAVRYGPRYLGSIGLFDPFFIQGAGRIAVIRALLEIDSIYPNPLVQPIYYTT